MNNQSIKLTTFIIVVQFAFYSHATKGSEIDNFFSEEKNVKVFEIALSRGQIREGRQKLIDGCLKESATNGSIDCDCYKKVLETTTDKEFFYESILAFRQYQAKVAALKNNDQEKYEKLKEMQAKRMSLGKRLQEQCE